MSAAAAVDRQLRKNTEVMSKARNYDPDARAIAKVLVRHYGDEAEAVLKLRQRHVLAHEPHPANVLIVYGRVGEEREPLPEEVAAVDLKKIHHYMDIYWKGTKRA